MATAFHDALLPRCQASPPQCLDVDVEQDRGTGRPAALRSRTRSCRTALRRRDTWCEEYTGNQRPLRAPGTAGATVHLGAPRTSSIEERKGLDASRSTHWLATAARAGARERPDGDRNSGAASRRLPTHDSHERIGDVSLAWLAKTRPPCQVEEVVGLVLDSREEHSAIFGRESKASLERPVGVEPGPQVAPPADPPMTGLVLLAATSGRLCSVGGSTQLRQRARTRDPHQVLVKTRLGRSRPGGLDRLGGRELATDERLPQRRQALEAPGSGQQRAGRPERLAAHFGQPRGSVTMAAAFEVARLGNATGTQAGAGRSQLGHLGETSRQPGRLIPREALTRDAIAAKARHDSTQCRGGLREVFDEHTRSLDTRKPDDAGATRLTEAQRREIRPEPQKERRR